MSRLIWLGCSVPATSTPTGAFSRSSTLVLDQLSIAHMGANLSISAQRSRYRRQQRLVLPLCHRLWSSNSAAFITLELVTWICHRPLPAGKCVEAWRWRAGESEFGRRRIRPLRPPLPRPSGPRVLSNFRRWACRCQRFSTPTEPHHLSRPVQRPKSVSGLYQLRFRREQDSQSLRGRNLHPALHLKRHGNGDRANIGAAHKGRLANGQLRLGRPTWRASQQASCTVGRPTRDEGRQHGKSLPYILPSSHSHSPRGRKKAQYPSSFSLVPASVCHFSVVISNPACDGVVNTDAHKRKPSECSWIRRNGQAAQAALPLT